MEKSIAEELNENFVPAGEMPTGELIENVSHETKGMNLSILKAPTGEGAIGEYLEHPMNFNNSKGMAQVLRGLTGMLGSLDLAIVDIIIGGLNLLKMNKKGAGENVYRGVSSS